MEKRKTDLKQLFADNWLILLLAAQPLLDTLAYWRQNDVATEAGYIRLAIMIVLPLYLLFTLKNKRKFILAMAAIGFYCALHVLNGFRVGYQSLYFDVAYLAKIAQMPVLAVCFVYLIRDEKTKNQAIKGFVTAAIITVLTLAVALATGTYVSTYHGGIGISGWVIDDNRCANSIIFVTLATVTMYIASVSKKVLLSVGIPVLISAILLANGTTACYIGLFAIFCGYAGFIVFRRFVTGEKIKKVFVITLVLLVIIAAAVYPLTPRAEISAAEAAAAGKLQNELDIKLGALGYDLASMSLEEKLNDPVVREIFDEYYKRMIEYVVPDMFQWFTMEEILTKYNMTTDAETIIDVRIMKINFASLIWDKCDFLTKLVGFEVTVDCGNGRDTNDMENDWHAVFYYCGYIGFAMYVLFVLYFLCKIIRRLLRDFKGTLTLFNCCLLIGFILMLGLAHFSGAVFRRPNVSIYLSVIMALINYQTCILPIKNEN